MHAAGHDTHRANVLAHIIRMLDVIWGVTPQSKPPTLPFGNQCTFIDTD